MNQPLIQLMEPVLFNGFEVRFCAYGFGWGYRSFAISYKAFDESHESGMMTREQICVAFRLARQQIMQAVLQHDLNCYQGQLIWLSLATQPLDALSRA
ncbi:MAG TPA: hypothetical protein VNE00_08750 [Paraburkholderia sp.]|jgi:hypothetical protein|nr:hypothetical protein [Paraburkholderia sp.]